MKRQGSQRFPKLLAALETGNWVADWTLDESAAGGWGLAVQDGYNNGTLDWTNNSGARTGLARYRLPYVAGRFTAAAGFEDQHTVHIRVRQRNDAAWQGWSLGPATACYAAGNGYAAVTGYAAGPVVAIYKVAAWVSTPILLVVSTPVEVDDVLSLSYSYNTSSARAELAVMVNGVVVGSVNDTTSPIRMSVVSGVPGIYGGTLPALVDTLDVGHWTPEWWVTDQALSFEEPPSKSQRTGSLRVGILNPQQYTDSDDPKLRQLLSGEVLGAKWTHKRLGGPTTMSCQVRFPDVPLVGVLQEHVEAKSFDDPSLADWSSATWLGGEMVLEYHYQEVRLAENPGAIFGTDTVWRGTVSGLTWNPDTRTINLSGEGMVNHLAKVSVLGTYENIRLKEIVRDLILRYGKGPSTSGQDNLVRYNAGKIVGDQGALDLRITIDFQYETLTSALRKLFEYLPPGAVWGVDTAGDFYMDQQFPHYTEDLGSSVGIQHFVVDGDAIKFSKSLDFSRIRTAILVQGKEKDNADEQAGGETRVQAWAENRRMRRMFGNRMTVQTDSSIRDQGLAQKVAAAQLKKLMLPAISANLVVSQPIADNRELWESLVLGAPRISVDDRQNNVQPFLIGGATDRIVTEYLLRLFGDDTAYRANEKGSAGGNCSLASTSSEQAQDTQWHIKVALKFDFNHPGGAGDWAFLFGRPDDTGAGNYGWGSLWWEYNTGNLQWRYRSSTGAIRVFTTGIVVPVAPAGQVVHLFLYRNALGQWIAYDSGALKGQDNTKTGDILRSTTGDWQWWDHGRGDLAATDISGDYSLDEWCLFDTTEIDALNPVGASAITDHLIDIHNTRLPRHRSHGLMLYLPFNGNQAGISSLSVFGWRAGAAVAALWSRSFATGTGDLAAISSGARRGQQVGQEKKWGGPLVMDAEQVTYKVDSASGILTREYKLGELPANVFTTLASIQDELRRMNEADRRNEEVAP